MEYLNSVSPNITFSTHNCRDNHDNLSKWQNCSKIYNEFNNGFKYISMIVIGNANTMQSH